ncbi:hypothetical protein [Chlorobium phaeobacteroides]|jgi:hypothetical protein|nr:hypothetical protein [Chlorobium phaeobacteroides]MBV5328160.1 hypothetical protein [Chlorobium sp.]
MALNVLDGSVTIVVSFLLLSETESSTGTISILARCINDTYRSFSVTGV